ncbi:MAG: hypothetical protein PVI26_10345 [Chitinispirillia bacterium]
MNLNSIQRLSLEIIGKIKANTRNNGIHDIFRIIYYYTTEFYWRVFFNIGELKQTFLKDVGINKKQCVDYSHTDFLDFRKAMKGLTINSNTDVFIDFGSGMGTTVLMASMYPFHKVIGIELSKEFNSIAEEYIKINRRKLKCRNIEFAVTDATKFIIPEQAAFLYFYNPFYGEILEKVIENVKVSLKRTPRELMIIFKNTEHFEKIKAISEWLIEIRRFRCFWGHDCVIYKARVNYFSQL